MCVCACVRACACACVQNCVTQIFDTREVIVTQSTTLAEEFTTNIRLFFLTLDQKIGEQTLSIAFSFVGYTDNITLVLVKAPLRVYYGISTPRALSASRPHPSSRNPIVYERI